MIERPRPNPEELKIGLFSAYPVDGVNGGVQDHIHHCAHELENMGHQVIIVAPRFGPASEKANIIYLGQGRKFPRIEGTTAIFDPFPTLGLYRAVQRFKREHPLDIAHHHEAAIAAASWLHLLTSEANLNIVTFHAAKKRVLLYYIFTPLVPIYRNRIDARIAVSTAARDFVSRYFPGQYQIIPNGVDTERFNPGVPKIERFSDDKLNILYVGRLEERKGVKYLIRVFGMIRKSRENIRLIIVGDGPLSKELKQQATDENVPDIIFCGRVKEDDLPSIESAADIVCSPATHGESFGIVLLEAMAAGKPIIAGDNAGYRDLITHGKNGFLVDPANSDEFAFYLNKLLSLEVLRSQMGENGRKTALQYDWKEVSKQLLDLYLTKLRDKKLI